MTLELRPVERCEYDAFTRLTFQAFGGIPDDDDLERHNKHFEADFAIGVFDQGRIVGTASAYPLEITLPAAAGHPLPVVAVPGVTAVGVAPTHRRQGVLTRIMNHQVADLRRRGYPVAVLLASEATIYGRFGYGLAQHYQSLAIDRARAAFRPEAAALAATGRLRMIDTDEAAKLLPLVHDLARRLVAGEMTRSTRWWELHLRDPEKRRGGGEARLYAVHESSSGEADGWVSYRFHETWGHSGLAADTVDVTDLVSTDRAGAAALWRLILDMDLVAEVRAPRRPVDEPLKWMLVDARQVRTTEVSDHLWVRVLDIAAALAARGYGAAERLVVEVRDNGRFVLESGDTSGECRAAKRGEKAHLVLGLAELGAIYLGGIAPSALAMAGRVNELQPGVLAIADRVFAGPAAPFCTLDF